MPADRITSLNTRVVLPAMPLDVAPTPAQRLNPVFVVQDAKVSIW